MDEAIDGHLKSTGRRPGYFNIPHDLWIYYCATKGYLASQYRGVRFNIQWTVFSQCLKN